MMIKLFLILSMCLTATVAMAQNNSGVAGSNGAPSELSISAAKVEIAQQLANPIADLVSTPFTYNFSRGVGQNQGGSAQTLIFQPVLPFNAGGKDLFILRPIVTGLREKNVDGFTGSGISSVAIESFYAPYTGSSWIWGIGPYAISPSGNSGYFGSQQTGAGISAAVVNTVGPWTYGILAYQSWSVGGNKAYGTQNNLYGQPFITYTNSEAWTISLEAQPQYNSDIRGTSNPVHFGIAKLVLIDKLPVSFSAGPSYYLSNTPGGPSGWGARAQISFAFPRTVLYPFN